MKKLRFLAFLCALAILLTGCWNYREIEALTIVSGMSIDKGKNGYKYHVTFQYVSMAASSSSTTHAEYVESEGNSVFDAIRNATKQMRSALFFCDTRVVIVSRELAEEGLKPLLDWFNRDEEAQATARYVVATSDNAGEIIKHHLDEDDISGFSIDKMIISNITTLGKIPDVQIYEIDGMLADKGIEPILPSISLRVSEKDTNPELQGTAVFKDDKLVGYLDDMESRYLLAIKNQLYGGVMITPADSDTPNIVLEINSSNTTCTPSVEDGVPKITLHINIVTNLAEDNSDNSTYMEKGFHAVEKNAAETIHRGVLNCIQKVQRQYGSDIFGFGSCFYRSNTSFWREHGEDWDNIFPSLTVDVSVDVQVTNTATANPRKS